MDLSTYDCWNELFEIKDVWIQIIYLIGPVSALKQRLDCVCKSARELMKCKELWYMYCKLRKLGFATESDFFENKDKHDWYDEYRRYAIDGYKRGLAIKSISDGKNILITGGAGVGKSHLFKEITKRLDEKEILYAVTSATGASAQLISGTTLHSWTGLGLFKDSVQKVISIYSKARKDSSMKLYRVVQIWRKTQTLLIDEVSMIDPVYFNKLDLFGRSIRGIYDKPFGGIQLVLCGDFCQLEAVKKEDRPAGWDYLFDLPNWKEMVDEIFYLTYSHRQQNDVSFFQILSHIRMGNPTQNDIIKLIRRKIEKGSQPGEFPCLFSLRKDAETINSQNLAKIREATVTYKMDIKFEGQITTEKMANMERDIGEHSTFAKLLELKKGCKVMLIRNIAIEQGLVNGACGKVIGFLQNTYPIVLFDNGLKKPIVPIKTEIEDKINSTKVIITQVPLVLAYAITIHKSQGMSLKAANMNFESVFGAGQAYVAISRVETLAGVHIIGEVPPNKFFAHPKVVDFYEDLEKKDIYLSTKPAQKEFNLMNPRSPYPTKGELKERLEKYKEEQSKTFDLSNVKVVKSELEIQEMAKKIIDETDMEVICIDDDSDSSQTEIDQEKEVIDLTDCDQPAFKKNKQESFE